MPARRTSNDRRGIPPRRPRDRFNPSPAPWRPASHACGRPPPGSTSIPPSRGSRWVVMPPRSSASRVRDPATLGGARVRHPCSASHSRRGCAAGGRDQASLIAAPAARPVIAAPHFGCDTSGGVPLGTLGATESHTMSAARRANPGRRDDLEPPPSTSEPAAFCTLFPHRISRTTAGPSLLCRRGSAFRGSVHDRAACDERRPPPRASRFGDPASGAPARITA